MGGFEVGDPDGAEGLEDGDACNEVEICPWKSNPNQWKDISFIYSRNQRFGWTGLRIWFIFFHTKMLMKVDVKLYMKVERCEKKWSKWINWASLLTRNLSPPFHTGLFIGLAHEWMIYFHCKVILPKLNEGLNIKIPWITEECWLRIVTNSLRKTSQKDYMHHSKIIQMIPDFWIEVLFKWENQTTCFSTKLIKAQQSNNSLEREDKVCSATKGTNLTSRKKTLAQGSGKKSLASQLMVGFRNPAVEPVELGSLSHVVVGDRS